MRWLAASMAVIIAVVVVGALVVTRSQGSAVTLPGPTAAERWTLQELTAHVDAGDVATVTLGANDSGGEMLLAQTRTGTLVAVTVNGSAADGAQALVALG